MVTFADILTALPNLSDGEKKKLLQKVMLELVAIFPEQEIVVLDDEQQPVIHCVPTSQYHPWISPELQAEIERRAALPGPGLTTAELLAKLEDAAAEQENVETRSRSAG